MLEVKSMRVYQSVKVGTSEYTYLNSDSFRLQFVPEFGCVLVDGHTLIPTNNIPWLQFKEKMIKPKAEKKKPPAQQAIEFE